MLLQAILIGLVAALGVLGDQMGSLYINRPIILAPLVGLIVGNLINAIPEFVTNGMAAAAGLLPALGFAMLMRMTINKQNIPYYFLGFILAAYMGVPVLGVAMIGVILVLVKFNFLDKQAATEAEAVQGVSDDDDF